MLLIDKFSSKPVYEQLIEGIERDILIGTFAEGAQLPSLRELSAMLSVNPNTIQKAYAELERRGFLYTVKGRGNFVHYQDVLLDEKKAQLADKIKQIIREAEELGIKKEELFMAVDER